MAQDTVQPTGTAAAVASTSVRARTVPSRPF